tara:strand:- start:999 stop:1211 length:213 start_codon:yes stop_codon:yes gene_type:complete
LIQDYTFRSVREVTLFDLNSQPTTMQIVMDVYVILSSVILQGKAAGIFRSDQEDGYGYQDKDRGRNNDRK